jgi:hypothetical protein
MMRDLTIELGLGLGQLINDSMIDIGPNVGCVMQST